METNAHLKLKQVALAFLRSAGCAAVATEVRCPISRYRVDVAGYADRWPAAGSGPPVQPGRRPGQRGHGSPPKRERREPHTIVIECKQCREDFLRDGRDSRRLLAHRDELERIRRHIEQRRIRVCEPHLRRSGTSLFPELEVWDFSASRLRGYRRLLREIRRLEEKLHGETKFFTIAHYRLADRLYIAAPAGLIRRRELPPGWGLLECSRRWLARSGQGAEPALRIAVEAPEQSSRTERRVRLLRNIAVAACRRNNEPVERIDADCAPVGS